VTQDEIGDSEDDELPLCSG